MPDLARVWTRAEVLALPDDGQRYELVDGELLVTPGPQPIHQIGVAALFRVVDPYVREHRLGMALWAPADLDLQSEQLVQPDLFVVSNTGNRPRTWEEVGIPLLVAEILSPSTARFDRVTKRRRYQRSGVPTYWIVDLDARLVEVWRPDTAQPEIVTARLVWQPDPSLAPLVIGLDGYFRDVWGR